MPMSIIIFELERIVYFYYRFFALLVSYLMFSFCFTANQFVVTTAFLDADAFRMSLSVHLTFTAATAEQTAARI